MYLCPLKMIFFFFASCCANRRAISPQPSEYSGLSPLLLGGPSRSGILRVKWVFNTGKYNRYTRLTLRYAQDVTPSQSSHQKRGDRYASSLDYISVLSPTVTVYSGTYVSLLRIFYSTPRTGRSSCPTPRRSWPRVESSSYSEADYYYARRNESGAH